jgi:SAM-dependent methyltransferase
LPPVQALDVLVQRVHEDRQGQLELELRCRSGEYEVSAPLRVSAELPEEPCLADPGLSEQLDCARPASVGLVEGQLEEAELVSAPDELVGKRRHQRSIEQGCPIGKSRPRDPLRHAGSTVRRMSFAVEASAYDRFMGRYSAPLSPQLADLAAVTPGQRVIDVGCGPGALTGELVGRLGAERVAAVDPSESFVAAATIRHPGVEVRQAPAESIPFGDGEFDVALAQLVVHFMADPVAGLREMARITRPGGVVAACVWDFGGDRGPISLFWTAARQLDPVVEGESGLAGARGGHLAELMQAAGLRVADQVELPVRVEHGSFEEWWEPFTLGVGPAGAYAAGLDDAQRTALEGRCRELAPDPFALEAVAWAVRAETVDELSPQPTS